MNPLNELFKLFGRIAVDNTEANRNIDDTTDKAEKSGSKLGAVVGKIGGFVGKAAKWGAAAIGTAATGLAALTKTAVSAYADYEQLVGGVETLFGSAYKSVEEYAKGTGLSMDSAAASFEQYQNRAQTVLDNAKNAYKTAGLSVNEYMETVTSFSASLIGSLGENAWQAANYADMAISDMSDNANKMGTSMEAIQNAYNGFSKGNFTMLDNLKLGYGGTKTEMERLLRKAEEIEGYVEGSLSLDSFADIVEAINIIQTDMGITGTTAKEAASTISGSIGMMKAAWTNFMTGMADPDQDFDALLGNLVDSIVTVANNLIPRIVATLPRLVQGLTTLVQTLATYIPEILESVLPALIEGAAAIVVELAVALPEILQIVGTVLLDSLQKLFSSVFSMLSPSVQGEFANVVSYFTPLIDKFGELKDRIGDAIQNHVLPAIEAFVGMIQNLWNENKDKLTLIVDLWNSAIDFIINLIVPFYEWLVDTVAANMGNIQAVIQSVIDIITGIVQFFTALFRGDWEGMWDAVKSILEAGKDFIINAFNLIKSFLSSILSAIWSVVKGAFDNIYLALSTTVGKIVDGIKSAFTSAKKFMVDIFTSVKNTIISIWDGIWSGIKGVINKIIGGIESMCNSVIRGINKLLKGVEDVANAAGELLGFDPVKISISEISLPRLRKGGVLKKGQVGLLEGDGAEAVVPLEKNREWIARVVDEMQKQGGSMGDNSQVVDLLNRIVELLLLIVGNGESLPDAIYESIAALRLNINNREFARLVKAVT